MELRQLEHLLCILETGSYRAAAAQLGLTQQALSKSVFQLEKQLGARLLNRGAGVIHTTELGAEVTRRARAIVSESRELRREVDTRLGRFRRGVRVGAGPSVASNLVANAAIKLNSEHPGVRIAVEGGTFYSMLDGLLAGDLDLLVSIEPDTRSRNELIAMEHLGDEECVIAARAQHPLSRIGEVRLADTTQFPWLLGSGMADLMKSVENTFKEEGLAKPSAHVETTSVSFARATLAASDFLCILPYQLIALDVHAGTLAPLRLRRGNWRRPITLSYRRNSTRSPLVLKFIDNLRQGMLGPSS